jgi:hypothetical protein
MPKETVQQLEQIVAWQSAPPFTRSVGFVGSELAILLINSIVQGAEAVLSEAAYSVF